MAKAGLTASPWFVRGNREPLEADISLGFAISADLTKIVKTRKKSLTEFQIRQTLSADKAAEDALQRRGRATPA
jgi:hypothetical protein